ncbi:MAG: MarR family transcriptional regulator [Candidatus Marinimicrobia bacterium]|nr:MarR family transcriptional regulator [Candidatus Neomarinimicrobiota bacterium]MCF7923344.1 MarR family transcriptional regulator [Candidatus Neomarinimicrobiota bacterium]
MKTEVLKHEFVNRFGDAYKDFGLPTLMGRIVGLLLYCDDALSLDTMTEELQVSKGPVSQILRRLRDHNLVKRIWVGGDRKDYYQVVDHVFLQAFINQAQLLKRNLTLAKEFERKLKNMDDPDVKKFKSRMAEMVQFNTQMQEHLNVFIEKWRQEQTDL